MRKVPSKKEIGINKKRKGEKKLDFESKIELSRDFELKVFKSEDIKDLIEIFNKSYSDIDDIHSTLNLRIEYKDGSSITTTDETVLKDTEMIDEISFTLNNYRVGKRIDMYISERKGSYSVQGYEEDWVRSKASTLNQYLKNIPNQNKYLSNFVFYALFSAIVSMILSQIFYIVFIKFFPSQQFENNFVLSTALNTFNFSLIYGSMLFLADKIRKLYPVIEFDTTRDYMNKRKKKKKYLITFASVIITAIVIPILLEVFVFK